jgi:hypothetical protein
MTDIGGGGRVCSDLLVLGGNQQHKPAPTVDLKNVLCMNLWICRGGFMLANIDFVTSISNKPALPTRIFQMGSWNCQRLKPL